MTVTLNKHPSDDVDEGGNVIDNEPITENLKQPSHQTEKSEGERFHYECG